MTTRESRIWEVIDGTVRLTRVEGVREDGMYFVSFFAPRFDEPLTLEREVGVGRINARLAGPSPYVFSSETVEDFHLWSSEKKGSRFASIFQQPDGFSGDAFMELHYSKSFMEAICYERYFQKIPERLRGDLAIKFESYPHGSNYCMCEKFRSRAIAAGEDE